MNQKTYNKGFTLIELSIALVIIGLLTGGILVGQSLINSARINAFIKQIQQYDIAVANFQTSYNSLPGDTNILDGDGDTANCESGVEGDNDGIIENRPDGAMFTCEADDFWPHLTQTKMLIDGTQYISYDNVTPWPETIGTVVPKSEIGKDNGVFIRNKPSGWLWFVEWAGAGAYEITHTGVGTMDGYGVATTDILALEGKIDDSRETTGSIVAIGPIDNWNYQSNMDGEMRMWVKILANQSMNHGLNNL